MVISVMKRVNKGGLTGKRKKREWMLQTGLIAYLIGLLIRIPLGRIIGDKGIGFFAAGLELAAVTSVIFSYGISRAVAILVKYRMKRDMYKSAKKVFRNAMLFSAVFGGMASAGIFFFSEWIAETVLLERMSYMAVAAAAPSIFLTAVMGVFRGYFQGIGTMMPTAHSRLLEKFIMAAASLMLGSMLYTYGLKVAALLKNNEYASAYGALGGALGLTAACSLGVIHLLLIYFMYSGSFKQQIARDTSKYTESGGQILSVLISAALPYILCALLYNLNYLTDQRLFNYGVNIHGNSAVRAMHWGVYYGKYSVVIGVAAILCILPVFSFLPKIALAFDRQEPKEALYKLEKSVHTLAVTTIPCAVITAVLAEPLVGMLFKGETKTAVSLIQAGSVVIILFSLAYFLAGVLQRIRKLRVVLLGGLAAYLLHLAVVVVLVHNTNLGIMGIIIGIIVFYLTACVAGFWGVRRYLQYSQEWFRSFAVPLIAAGVAGIIGMLLNKALLTFAGNIITFFVSLFVCLILYNVLLIVLKGIREDELEDIPGGRILVVIAEKIHLM